MSKVKYHLAHMYSFAPLPLSHRKVIPLLRPDKNNDHFNFLRELKVFFYRTSILEMNNTGVLIQPEDTPQSYEQLINMKNFTAYKSMGQFDPSSGAILRSPKITESKLRQYGDDLFWMEWNTEKFIKSFDQNVVVEA